MTQNPLYVKGVNIDLNSDKLSVCNHTIAHQAPLFMGLSQEEHQGELPFPTPEDLPDPGTEPSSFPSPALTGRFFPGSATREALQEGGTRQSSHCRLFPCDSTNL